MVESTIVSRKMIKPSSPTPSSLSRHNLCFLDHIATSAYAPIAVFYPKPTNNISQILENSLSKVLSSYYPFAGIITDNKYVDCNDTGAEFLNVRISCSMSEILDHAYNDAIDVVFPPDLPWTSSFGRSPLVVQLSHFDCGGIAISICLSHKIVDGYSLFKFLKDWAATSQHLDFKPSTQFDANSFFPLMDDPPVLLRDIVREPQRCVSRIYHFSSSSLDRLKEIVAMNSQVQNPTRVEVATALLHKCGASVSMTINSGVFQPSLLFHVMNFRPPLPLNTIGNACSAFASAAILENEIQVPNFVAQLREAKKHLQDKLKDPEQLTSYVLETIKGTTNKTEKNIVFDFYMCTSLCNFGLHNIDFGWGNPIRVTVATNSMKNHFIFMDSPSGDGIDVLITLTEADMLIFHNNKELLEFASPVVLPQE
ncbi:acylsugar acyltransferase 3-like [Nicotiana tabacum]|uniref:Acylsugar acyltransferase 3-like n=2 Tax=Nicotiana TaxID=4085 RepID=A0A1S4CHT1_TOBAC|nr:PREDICTED: deacetylvindoline O-acetyltransferase-like [Nicotiana sylvestris]XP_016500728.1 PREDICTED: acylsugar acyltransferase 3-like [Nicotiana tabacum]